MLYLCPFFCLFVCPPNYSKSCERILTTFSKGEAKHKNNRLDFGGDKDHDPDTGIPIESQE